MRAIWTDENKLRIWLQIEMLASEALAADGIVPKKDLARMKAGAEKCFADTKALTERAKELERQRSSLCLRFRREARERLGRPLEEADFAEIEEKIQMVLGS
jgi:adenylosuccinate lyase